MSHATQSTPRLEFVVAVARSGVIGRGNTLPWRLPADLRRFRRLTMGRPILMGRRTFDSIGRPLPGRRNIVLTADPGWHAPGVVVVHSLVEARAAAQADVLFVIGGAELYRALLADASVIHLTEVHADIDGDTRFPSLAPGEWRETAREEHPADAEHAYPYAFVTLVRSEPAYSTTSFASSISTS
jgi:dihydrofolate reductase